MENPDDIYTLDALGFLYYRNKDFKKAMVLCEKSIKLRPDNYYAYNGLGLCLIELNRIEEGIKNILYSIEINPDFFDAHYDLAMAYTKIGQYEKARFYFNSALKIDKIRAPEINRALSYINSKKIV